MAGSNVKLLALLTLAFAAPAAAPATSSASLPIDLVAQSADYNKDTVVFRRVKITQGAMSISADQGQGVGRNKNVDFDDSIWVFRGNVRITMDQGQLNADTAEITFVRQRLAKAVANGSPAVFESHLDKTGKVAHGHADTIHYDGTHSIVTLQNNAWLSDGQREIRGDSLKYDALARTTVAEGTDPNAQHVHIVFPPPPAKP